MYIKNQFDTQLNNKTHNLCKVALLFMTMHSSSALLAEDVKMYNHVPSANEMANLLFPEASKPSAISKGIKTRSISFDPISTLSEPIAKSVGIGLPIRFDYNSDAINSASRPYINELGQMLTYEGLSNKKIMIEGHTDASGTAQYNKQLSLKRAKSIKQYLSKNYNIDNDRMIISGKGEYSPLSGKNPYAAVNRRVEIHKYD